MFKKISTAYLGGSIGAFVLTCVFWLFIKLDLFTQFGIIWPMPHTGHGFIDLIYKNIFWGGIAGLLFTIPWIDHRPVLKVMLFSLIPAFVMLLFYIPKDMGGSMFGVGLGTYTFVVILIAAWFWGAVTEICFRKHL